MPFGSDIAMIDSSTHNINYKKDIIHPNTGANNMQIHIRLKSA
jgi:hypothetical protein